MLSIDRMRENESLKLDVWWEMILFGLGFFWLMAYQLSGSI